MVSIKNYTMSDEENKPVDLVRPLTAQEGSDEWDRTFWYEGNDPAAFIKEMQANYPEVEIYIDSVRIECPAHLVKAIYRSGKYPLGS
jgi:hypothetical protein